jgi:hypothetical protein
MLLTTLDVVKSLPFDQEFKNKLVEKFDKLNPDQKFVVESTVWDMYNAIYKLKLNRNIEIALKKAIKDHLPTDRIFYAKIKQETEKEMDLEFYKNVEQTDLSRVRSKLEEIMKKN